VRRFKASVAACLNGGGAPCFKAALDKENAAPEICKKVEDSRLAVGDCSPKPVGDAGRNVCDKKLKPFQQLSPKP